jgi:hypothetical protein
MCSYLRCRQRDESKRDATQRTQRENDAERLPDQGHEKPYVVFCVHDSRANTLACIVRAPRKLKQILLHRSVLEMTETPCKWLSFRLASSILIRMYSHSPLPSVSQSDANQPSRDTDQRAGGDDVDLSVTHASDINLLAVPSSQDPELEQQFMLGLRCVFSPVFRVCGKSLMLQYSASEKDSVSPERTSNQTSGEVLKEKS